MTAEEISKRVDELHTLTMAAIDAGREDEARRYEAESEALASELMRRVMARAA